VKARPIVSGTDCEDRVGMPEEERVHDRIDHGAAFVLVADAESSCSTRGGDCAAPRSVPRSRSRASCCRGRWTPPRALFAILRPMICAPGATPLNPANVVQVEAGRDAGDVRAVARRVEETDRAPASCPQTTTLKSRRSSAASCRARSSRAPGLIVCAAAFHPRTSPSRFVSRKATQPSDALDHDNRKLVGVAGRCR